MPVTPTYPGVYIEEVPSGVRSIAAVATSITAFIGRSLRGPVNDPVRIFNFGEYQRAFGDLSMSSTMSYAVQQFFLNGGTDAVIVRVIESKGAKATIKLDAGANKDLILEASSEGAWGNNLRASVDHETRYKKELDKIVADLAVEDIEAAETARLESIKAILVPKADAQFNLMVEEIDPTTKEVVKTETLRNLSITESDPRFYKNVLTEAAVLVKFKEHKGDTTTGVGKRPVEVTNKAADATTGKDGDALTNAEIAGSALNKEGIYALEKTDLFNMLCLPPLTRIDDINLSTWNKALAYCKKRRAMLIVDAPIEWNNAAKAKAGTLPDNMRDENAAIFFPRLRMGDPLQENRPESFPPCGVVAGVFARTDAQRGVWKAPAGIEASLKGASGLSVKLTDGENGLLNPIGINCLRSFPVIGSVVWGSRTLRGADMLASEWKYIPVRRLALMIEESLFRGTQWVVFEPNDEPLWAQIRLNLGSFMHNLFRQGAFQGQKPAEAYYVKCDKETTTQADIDLGVVNILIGFAPLKPAEFVMIKIQQIAGQTAA